MLFPWVPWRRLFLLAIYQNSFVINLRHPGRGGFESFLWLCVPTTAVS